MKLPKALEDEKEVVNVIVETPKGSANKYKYEPKSGCFVLHKVLPEGLVFPLDFGFIPGTRAEDGDPLDVMILMNGPVYPGSLLKCKLMGVIEVSQTEKGSNKSTRNDRLLAIPIQYINHFKIENIGDIDKNVIEDIIAFFEHYFKKEERAFEVLQISGPKKALSIIKENIFDPKNSMVL